MKKAQMEIMGLTIIVILFTLGLLFSIKFIINEKNTSPYKSYVRTELAANTLNTLLRTNIKECKNIDVFTLFDYCGSYYNGINANLDCENDGNYFKKLNDKEIPDSCYYITKIIEMIMNNTLELWKIPYNLSAKYPNGVELDFLYNIPKKYCSLKAIGISKQQVITTNAGELTFNLKICAKELK